jgi:hypothetical protein
MPSFYSAQLPVTHLFPRHRQLQTLLGSHFFCAVAPPGNDLSGPDWLGLFHPHDPLTYVGQAISVALGNLAGLPQNHLVFLSVRDFQGKHGHQLDIAIPRKQIVVAPRLPSKWIKIGAYEITRYVDSTPPFSTTVGASMPKAVSLARKPRTDGTCYDWKMETLATLQQRRQLAVYP